MNFYICSTVRHLLFSLLKALSEPGETHQILFFSDFQNTSLDNWDLSNLPENIRVDEGSRREFRSCLTTTLRGKLFYFLAMRNLMAPAYFRTAFNDTLLKLHPGAAKLFKNPDRRTLWLFNERNKMARAFRLVTQEFSMIEEGSGNYHYFKKPWWRWPGRALLGRPANKLSFGEDRRCKKLLVSYPDKVPPFVRHKAVKINFLDTADSKTSVRNMFKDVLDFERLSRSVIVATSPLDIVENIDKKKKLKLYSIMVESLSDMGMGAILKLHPREDPQDYAAFTGSIEVAPEKLPLEVMIMLSDKPVTILSFFTSAGIGLEPYFNMVELCERSDSDGYEIGKLHDWAENPGQLSELIKARLSQ